MVEFTDNLPKNIVFKVAVTEIQFLLENQMSYLPVRLYLAPTHGSVAEATFSQKNPNQKSSYKK